jgi:hypothetical protein
MTDDSGKYRALTRLRVARLVQPDLPAADAAGVNVDETGAWIIANAAGAQG